jgi:type I restriction enzyme, S subunit
VRVIPLFLTVLESLLPLPPLAEQRRIAEILEGGDTLGAKRRAALAQLDTLTQAIFLELFGDPAANPKGWERVQLGDVIFSASDGPHVSPKYSDVGVPFLSTRHVRAGEITWEDLKFISHEDAEVHWRKCKPERGDILYTKGGTTGLAALVKTTEPFAVWVHIALLKPNPAKVDPMWLESMLNCEFCYRQSQDLTHGIANRDLGLTRMVKINIFLPPLPMQSEFVHRVVAVQKLKTASHASLVELDTLFSTLQYRAFRGEL